MTSYEHPQIEPPLPQWSGLLAARRPDQPTGALDERRASARHRLIGAAEQFVLRLHDLARSAGLPDNRLPLLTGDPSRQPIVMAGHQPVLIHSGLTFKYETTEQFAADRNAIAVAIVIDTDEGDAGSFSFPTPTGDEGRSPTLESRPESVGGASGMMADASLKPAEQLSAIAGKVTAALRDSGEASAAESAKRVLGQYAQLSDAGASVMEANLILRWLHGIGGRMLELPLSAIAAFPETMTLITDIIRRGPEFAAAYNRELADFRHEHNIRNAANPFPDLHVAKDQCELPFWVVDHNRQARHALHVSVGDRGIRLQANAGVIETFADDVTTESLDSLLLRNLQIVPRAALITTFSRMLFAELFVHGTGGGHYEPFNDRLIRSWWNVEPTPFAVASASRFLFAEQRAALERLDRLSGGLRDLQHNPQRHFGTRTFTPETEAELHALVEQKQAAVDRMKAAHKSGESAKDIGREIQELSNRIKQTVADAFQQQLAALERITPDHRAAVNCRTWPWFMFRTKENLPK